MYSRFFAFGCSFTSYYWPTWADILGQEFRDNFYNLGMCGAGNEFIFHKLIEAHERYHFTSDDLIIICWSNFAREDRYKDNRWLRTGDIYRQSRYPSEWIEKYFDFRGALLKSSNFIAGATHLLNSVGCEYMYTSMCKMSQVSESKTIFVDDEFSDIFNLYKKYYSQINISMTEHLFGKDSLIINPMATKIKYRETDKSAVFDHHPTPKQHCQYLIDIILPTLKIKIPLSASTLNWIDDWDYKVFTSNPFVLHRDGWTVEERINKWHKNMC